MVLRTTISEWETMASQDYDNEILSVTLGGFNADKTALRIDEVNLEKNSNKLVIGKE